MQALLQKLILLLASLDNGADESDQATSDYNLKNIIALSSQSGKDISFTLTTETDGNGATAEAPRDYDIISNTYTISAGQTQLADDLYLILMMTLMMKMILKQLLLTLLLQVQIKMVMEVTMIQMEIQLQQMV